MIKFSVFQQLSKFPAITTRIKFDLIAKLIGKIVSYRPLCAIIRHPALPRKTLERVQDNIGDIEQLRTLASTTAIIAIDIDRYTPDRKTTHHNITRLGIAFLTPVASPASLDALVQQFPIQRYSIRDADWKRNPREEYRYGSGAQVIPADQVEDAALTIVNSFTGGVDPKPLLTGYGMGYEFTILTCLYPRLLTECFSAWVDLQEITNDISLVTMGGYIIPRQQRAFMPCMGDTPLALGYQEHGIAVTSLRDEHSAGNDTACILAVLLGPLALLLPTDPTVSHLLTIEHHGRRRQSGKGGSQHFNRFKERSAALTRGEPVISSAGKKERVEYMKLRKYSEEAQAVRLQRGEKRAENHVGELAEGLGLEENDREESHGCPAYPGLCGHEANLVVIKGRHQVLTSCGYAWVPKCVAYARSRNHSQVGIDFRVQ